MANMTGYEEFVVGLTAVGPTASMVSGNNSICAVFYVDPDSPGDVRYRADQTDPTSETGLPLRPGKHLVVAGKGGIMNAKFISRDGGRCKVYALYYDQVDVIAADLGDPSQHDTDALLAKLARQEELLELILAEARRRNQLLEIMTNEEVPVEEFLSQVA